MIDFDHLFNSLPSCGWLTEDEARLLWDAVNSAQGDILEVGVYHGRSTCLLAATGRPVYAVDRFKGFDSDDPSGDKAYQAVRNNLKERGIGNVTLCICRIEDWPVFPCGFAYLDGDHSYQGTAAQIIAARACGVRVVAIHDITDHGGGMAVKKAATDLLGPYDEIAGRLAVWRLR